MLTINCHFVNTAAIRLLKGFICFWSFNRHTPGRSLINPFSASRIIAILLDNFFVCEVFNYSIHQKS
jgi:hypothetical protein